MPPPAAGCSRARAGAWPGAHRPRSARQDSCTGRPHSSNCCPTCMRRRSRWPALISTQPLASRCSICIAGSARRCGNGHRRARQRSASNLPAVRSTARASMRRARSCCAGRANSACRRCGSGGTAAHIAAVPAMSTRRARVWSRHCSRHWRAICARTGLPTFHAVPGRSRGILPCSRRRVTRCVRSRRSTFSRHASRRVPGTAHAQPVTGCRAASVRRQRVAATAGTGLTGWSWPVRRRTS